MVGNKLDLEAKRQVPRERALEFKKQHGIKYWIETSAKSGDNINQLFFDAAKFLYQKIRDEDDGSGTERSNSMASKESYADSKSDNQSNNGEKEVTP